MSLTRSAPQPQGLVAWLGAVLATDRPDEQRRGDLDGVRWCLPRWRSGSSRSAAAWARRALAGDWPTRTRHAGQTLELVCRPNLDLHIGMAGWYRQRHGNLRTDGPQAVLGRALDQGGRPTEVLWFGPDPLPSVAELAASHGDHHGQGVHFSADSVRYLWLDRAARLTRRHPRPLSSRLRRPGDRARDDHAAAARWCWVDGSVQAAAGGIPGSSPLPAVAPARAGERPIGRAPRRWSSGRPHAGPTGLPRRGTGCRTVVGARRPSASGRGRPQPASVPAGCPVALLAWPTRAPAGGALGRGRAAATSRHGSSHRHRSAPPRRSGAPATAGDAHHGRSARRGRWLAGRSVPWSFSNSTRRSAWSSSNSVCSSWLAIWASCPSRRWHGRTGEDAAVCAFSQAADRAGPRPGRPVPRASTAWMPGRPQGGEREGNETIPDRERGTGPCGTSMRWSSGRSRSQPGYRRSPGERRRWASRARASAAEAP